MFSAAQIDAIKIDPRYITNSKILNEEFTLLKQVMDMISLVTVISNLLAVYVVIKHSPPYIGLYKRYLLNIIFWSALLDLFISVVYKPHLPLPCVCVCSSGLLEDFQDYRLQFLLIGIFIWLTGAVGASIFTAFLFQYCALSEQVYLLHRPRSLVLIVLLHLTLSLPVAVLGVYVSSIDYDRSLEFAQKIHPHDLYFLGSKACIVLMGGIHNELRELIAKSLVSEILVVAAVCFVIIGKILLYIHKFKANMSSRTVKSRTNLIVSLIVQSVVPVCCVALPFILLLTMVFFQYNDYRRARFYAILFFVGASLHSTANAFTMLLLIKPYREVIFNSFTSMFCPRTQIYDGNQRQKNRFLNLKTWFIQRIRPTKHEQTIPPCN